MSDVAGAEIAKKDAANPGPRHVIIVGFGLSGRACASAIMEQDISYAVIEANPETVTRCEKGGLNIINGDARNLVVLRQAGIDRATDLMVTLPNDQATLEIVQEARRLNPNVRIIARCTFVSGGLEATRRGADDVVVSEQVVAEEFARVTAALLLR